MKLAISGKGGVGKTLLAALLTKMFADSGHSVFAIDTDLANRYALTSSPQMLAATHEIYQNLAVKVGV